MLVYNPVHHCLSIASMLLWRHSCQFGIPYTEGLVDKKDHRGSRTPPVPWNSWHTNPSVFLFSMINGNSAHYCAHCPLPRISESSTNEDRVMVHFDPILGFWKLLKHLKHENKTAVFLFLGNKKSSKRLPRFLCDQLNAEMVWWNDGLP